MALNYRQFLEVGREQWIVQPTWLRKTFIQIAGPLGVHARIRNARVINSILRLHLPEHANILDAGCGHAYSIFWLAKHFPQYQFTGVELDPFLIQNGQKIASTLRLDNVKFVNSSIIDISDTNAYDLIISIDVLEHVIDDLVILHNFREALHSDGYLLLHLPRRHQEHRRVIKAFKNNITPGHVRDEYTAKEILEKLQLSAFSVEYLCYGFSLWGELAFELNYLFWEWEPMRILSAILFHPLSIWLAYMDSRKNYDDGNSLLVLAKPAY